MSVAAWLAVGAACPLAADPLELENWTGDLNVPDPVALSVAPDGTVYVTHSQRRKVADLDIRQFRQWIPDEVGLRSVEERRGFLRRMLPEQGRTRPWGDLADHNEDGFVDWRDMTVPSEKIFRLRDTDGDGRADELTVFADGFNTEVTGIAAGVKWWDGDVYATIAPDLWRLTDTTGDGVADRRESLAHGFAVHIAYAGHDMHGLTMGPDGRIYWTMGDKGAHVETADGRVFAYPHEGLVLRAEPDGSGFEVFNRGTRNVQEIAFDQWGNLFGVDNDADFSGERERFLYLVEGADYGWRIHFQYRGSAYNPWMAEDRWRTRRDGQPGFMIPSIRDYVDGPAGFAFNPGTALGPAFADHFFVNQFPAGRMNAFRVEPDGAGFRMVGDRVVSSGVRGVGMAWGPDGRLYFTDWAGGFDANRQGAVWRADVAEDQRHPLREDTARWLREGVRGLAPDQLVELLAHADQRVRLRAQFELVRQGAGEELARVAGRTVEADEDGGESALLARVHALWGLGQRLRAGAASAAELRQLERLLEDEEAEVRAQTARVWGDSVHGQPTAEVPDLRPLLADDQPRVRLLAALATARIGRPDHAGALIELAADNAGECAYLRHATAFALSTCLEPAELAAMAEHPDVHVRHSAVIALGRQRAAELAGFVGDSEAFVVREAAIAIYDSDEPVIAALPALAALATPERLAGADDDADGSGPDLASAIRALAANRALGTEQGAAALVAVAGSDQVSATVRQWAVSMLLEWDKLVQLDMVDGARRDHDAGDPVLVSRALVETPIDLEALAADDADDDLRSALQSLLNEFGPPDPERALALLADRSVAEGLRIQALDTLAESEPEQGVEQALQLVKDHEETARLRLQAVGLLIERQPEEGLKAFEQALDSEEPAVLQLALRLAAEVVTTEVASRLEPLAERAQEGDLPRAAELDWLLALDAHAEADHARSRALAAQAQAHRDAAMARVAEEPLAPWSFALEGGDAEAGRQVFLTHLAANCTSCHAVEPGSGSAVGPALAGIGSRHDRDYLLESLVLPQADITEGYGLVTAMLEDDELVAGNLQGEADADPLVLRLADGTDRRIPRRQIVEQTPAISVMPPQMGILTPVELRDLMEYLASLE